MKLNISEDDNALELDLAMDIHEYFRLDEARARTIIEEVKNVVRQWPELSNKYGISRVEQELLLMLQ
ncbi:MAG: hypothetical protein Tsb0034_21550 [Ekhidna sp.]